MTEAALFYESESAGLGFEFLDDVQRVVNALREYPKLGQTIGRGIRRALLRRFPFSLIYSEESDGILIVAVAHQKRRPGYWDKRIGPSGLQSRLGAPSGNKLR